MKSCVTSFSFRFVSGHHLLNMMIDFPNPSLTPPKNGQRLKITIFMDDADAWIVPWGERLGNTLSRHHDVEVCLPPSSLGGGDICFLLGCTKVLQREALERHTLNLVVHESALPSGRGWSPVQWQILDRRDEIPVVMFQATEEADAGPIFLRGSIKLDGTELLPEIRFKQGAKTLEMVCRFLDLWPDIEPEMQEGDPTWYRRRNRDDDRLDVDSTLAAVFDQLRIADNEKYPTWFEHRGRRYLLKIFPTDDIGE